MEWAREHDRDGQPWPELAAFLDVIECRARAVSARQEFREEDDDLPDPPPTTPPVPTRCSERLRHKRFGVDLALELCFTSLERLSGMEEYHRVIEDVDYLSSTSQREPILLLVNYARKAGLIPPG